MIPTPVVVISGLGAAFGASVILKDYYGDRKYSAKHDILGKTAIVTGATRGIGKETARELAKRGGRILLACRDMEACEKVRREIIDESFNTSMVCKHLDLGSCESVRKFAKEVNEEEKRLDMLVNNAGVMTSDKLLSSDGFELQLVVNFLGPFLLTQLLLDKLKQSNQARIINLVSPMYKKGKINFEDLNSANSYDAKGAFGQSRLAMMLYSQELARRLKDTNVTVNCVNPGVTKTDIGRHMPMAQSWFSTIVLEPLMWLSMKSPTQGAQTSIYLALDPELEKVSGKLFVQSKQVSIDKVALDNEVALRLWKVAEVWTKLKS